jgi:hypothetical protein
VIYLFQDRRPSNGALIRDATDPRTDELQCRIFCLNPLVLDEVGTQWFGNDTIRIDPILTVDLQDVSTIGIHLNMACPIVVLRQSQVADGFLV